MASLIRGSNAEGLGVCPMTNYLASLTVLLNSPHYRAHRAAMHLVATEVVKANPLPSPAVCDAEMEALWAQ
jgi:hypothetical protein